MDPIYIIGIAVIVLIVVGMVAAIIINQQREQRAQTVALIRGGAIDAGPNKKEAQNQRRADLAKKLKEENEASKKKKGVSFSDQLAQAGIKMSPAQFWITALLFSVVLAGVGYVMGLNAFVCLMMFFIALFGLPRALIKNFTERRQKKFLEDFADALEAMIRLLKAGMPVSEAISMVGREFTGPVGEEMSKIYDTQKIGVPLHEACYEATKRMPLTEMQMFATGIAIQAQTGASLSEVLGNLANVIRARFRLKRKVKSLSSEAKSSAMIIGALPVLISTGIYLINPDYIGVLFTDDFGRILIAARFSGCALALSS